MDSQMQEAPERVWVAKMFYRTSERGSASLNESVRHSVPYVREDVHAAALADAQATIARLEALLQEAVDTLDDGWGTEQVTKEAAEAYFELMPRLKAELSPREGEG